MNKTERFIEANLGTNSAFYEMLMHLCEDPQDAMVRNVPTRLASQLEYVLKNVLNNTKNNEVAG
jgi:GTP cyclohydrolase I